MQGQDIGWAVNTAIDGTPVTNNRLNERCSRVFYSEAARVLMEQRGERIALYQATPEDLMGLDWRPAP